jgi:hypothetical protein
LGEGFGEDAGVPELGLVAGEDDRLVGREMELLTEAASAVVERRRLAQETPPLLGVGLDGVRGSVHGGMV